MSNKRKELFSTPSSKRVNSAFKSPFRSPSEPKPSSSNCLFNEKTLSGNGTSPLTVHSLTSNNKTPNNKSIKRFNNKKFNPGSFKSPVVNKQITLEIVNQSLASPLLKKSNANPRKILPVIKANLSPEEELKFLIQQEKDLDEEIAVLEGKGYRVEELKTHIDKLHTYNELKDTAQMLMGRIAELEGESIKAMHIRYEVDNLEN